MTNQSFFDFMYNEHGLILTESEIDDIFHEVYKCRSDIDEISEDPYLRLHEITEELLIIKQSLPFADKQERFKAFAKIDKLIKELRTIDFEQENKRLKDYYGIESNS